jgi:hypothetical protein
MWCRYFWNILQNDTNVMYVSMNKQLVFRAASASGFVFAAQRVKRRFFTSKVSAGKVTLRREQFVACEVRVELAWPRPCNRSLPISFPLKVCTHFRFFLTCYMPYLSYRFYLFIFLTFVKSTVTNLVTVLCFPACWHTVVIVSELCTFAPKLKWPNSCGYVTTVRRTKFNVNPLR